MTVILLSLIPLIGWGAGDYIAARGARKINAYTLSFFMMIFGFLVTVPLSLALGLPEITAETVGIFFASSICFNAGFLLMLRGFHYGPVGIVAPIANSYAFVTTLYTVVFQGANPSFSVISGIAVVISGIALVSYSKPKPGEFKDRTKTILYAVLSHISFGFAFILLDRGSTQEWNQNTAIVQSTGFVVATIIWIVMQHKNKIQDFKIAYKMPSLYLGGALGGSGLLAINVAFGMADNIAVPTAIAAAAPLVTALLAYLIDKEHLTLIQRFATVIIIGGIILLSL